MENDLVKVVDFASKEGRQYAEYLFNTQEANPSLRVHEDLLNPIRWFLGQEYIEHLYDDTKNEKSVVPRKRIRHKKSQKLNLQSSRKKPKLDDTQTRSRKDNAPETPDPIRVVPEE